ARSHRDTQAQARDRAAAGSPRGDGRPRSPSSSAAQPALQRHQVLYRRRPRHAERAARRHGARARRRDGHGHRDRPRGPGQAVSGIRAARRKREPPLRRNGPGPRALHTTRGAARRHHRRGLGAWHRQHLLVHPAARREPAGARLMATIVVVEDQPDNLKLITALLPIKGPRVTGLMWGEPLVATLLAEQPPPALVLLDIQLPGRDGYSVLGDVKRIEG